jgi:hypothetical protein
MPAESRGGGRGEDHRQHQAQRAEPGAFEHEDQRDRHQSDRDGLQVKLARVDQGVEGAGDAVGSAGLVAGEVGQLAQDDIDADRADETDHDAVRHEPQD